MTCQKCQSREATIQITERMPPRGLFGEAHYCEPCGRALVPPIRAPFLPSKSVLMPSRDELARALIAAARDEASTISPREASEFVLAYLKQSIQRRRRGGSH